MSPHPPLELSHTTLGEEEALRFLEGHRISLRAAPWTPRPRSWGSS